MIFIEARHLKIVQDILRNYPYSFYVFGSRARGNPRQLSDLDLCFFDDIPWAVRAQIDEDFEESDLPYKVDVIDWNQCDLDFKKLIAKDLIFLQKQ